MSKFEQYNIVLTDIPDGTRTFEYDLNDDYFARIDSPEVQRGSIKAIVKVAKKTTVYELSFEVAGTILIPCDRCLDDMEQPINHLETIQVKLGDNYSDENETVVIPRSEGAINIAWFLYEFIVVNIPIKHIHAPGECNKNMIHKLKRHITHQKEDVDENDPFDQDDDEIETEDRQTDPRWENLQNINFDHN